MESRHPVSQALAELRRAIGKTQQEFATQVLKTSLVTIARYETSHPPRGNVLLRLADIAEENKLPDIARVFRHAFAQEAFKRIGEHKGLVAFQFSEDGDSGFMFEILLTPEEYAYAEAFQVALASLRKHGKEKTQARNALMSLFEAAAPLMRDDDQQYHRKFLPKVKP